MILVLGGTGYIGSAFVRYFEARKKACAVVSRSTTNYYDVNALIGIIRDSRATFLINAAGYTGKPNVDACEFNKADCLLGNAVLPGIVREACEATRLPWGHISSGCIYTGAHPNGTGFREIDPPNFDFRHNNCSFYSGCKALGEECLQEADNVFVWRVRIPFSHEDSPRNYLSKLQQYDRLLEARNSISDLDEFVRVCWECWDKRVPFGIYNVTNSGSVTTREAVDLIKKILNPEREFQFFADEEEFLRLAAKTPRSNCVLDNSKLKATGIQVSEVHDAIERALKTWSNGRLTGRSGKIRRFNPPHDLDPASPPQPPTLASRQVWSGPTSQSNSQ